MSAPTPPPPPPPPTPTPTPTPAPTTGLAPVQPTPGVRVAWLAVGSVLALLLGSFATAQVVGLLGHEETTRVDIVDGRGLEALNIETAGGTVRIVGGDVDDIEIRAKISRGITETTYRQEVIGQDLVIRVGCGDEFANHWCQVTLDITVPRDLDVGVLALDDPVHVSDVVGRVEVESEDEPVHLSGLGGPVQVRVGNSFIRGTDLDSPQLDAYSDNGSVDLTYRTPPEGVIASSTTGDVTVELPVGDQLYAVVTASGTGSDETLVKTDPKSDRTVSARSDNGDITVRYVS